MSTEQWSTGYNERLRAALALAQAGHRRADPEVLRVMQRAGGAFVANLASAWLHADATNQRILFDNFGHYYRTYEDTLRDEQRRRDAKGRDTP